MENDEKIFGNQEEETIVATPPEAYEKFGEDPIVQPVQTPAENPIQAPNFAPAVHAVAPVNPQVEIKKSRKGAAVFVVALAIVIALVLGTGSGFILGREYDNLKQQSANNPPKVSLAEKPEGNGYTTESVYDIVSQSVVRIAIYGGEAKSYGFASGVIYSEDGYIITNDHIYEDIVNAKFIVQTKDGTKYDAEFIAGDTRSDLAVLKIDAKGLTPAVFGDSEKLIVGETVVAVGNPDGAEKSVATSGIVSAVNIWVSGTTSYSTRLIQTDAALNPGSSGGALSNVFGQVVGITSSKIIADDTDLVNYAIPTSVMKRVADSLIANGYVTGRSMLGITYSEVGIVESAVSGYPCGLYIQSITAESGLNGKGLKKGDVITHVNGQEITSSSVMLAALENTPAGTNIELGIHTLAGKKITLEVQLKEYVGESSYKTEEAPTNSGEFDFPMGD